MKQQARFIPPPPRPLARLALLAALLVAMTLATPAMAQTTAQINPIKKSDQGANIHVNPTTNWDAAQRAWRVSYSVNMRKLSFIRGIAQDGFSNPAVLNDLNATIAKYERAGGPWYQMRYANTYKSGIDCENENPAAYNSELVGGTGWYRSFLVAPGEATCLTVWMYGDNLFSPKGHSYGGNGFYPLGSAWFRGPTAPSP